MDKLFMCALRFRRSGRIQDVRSCWQQVCNFINRRREGAAARKNQRGCVAFCRWGSFKKSRTILFPPFQEQQRKSAVRNISHHIFKLPRYPVFPTNDLTSLRAGSSCLPMRVFFPPTVKSRHNDPTSVAWFIFHTSSNRTSCENSCRCNLYHWSCEA